jgi:hypothetical protein
MRRGPDIIAAILALGLVGGLGAVAAAVPGEVTERAAILAAVGVGGAIGLLGAYLGRRSQEHLDDPQPRRRWPTVRVETADPDDDRPPAPPPPLPPGDLTGP